MWLYYVIMGSAVICIIAGSFDKNWFEVGIGVFTIIFLQGMKYFADKDIKSGNYARRLEQEKREAEASQKDPTPWRIRYATYPCPHCGHYKVRSAKWEDKKLSVAFWGPMSSALGKEFKCEHCGRMW